VPVYVYECDQCGERFEYSHSMNDPPKSVCEKCGGKLVRVIAPTSFHLKGGGWYKDLYSSKKKDAKSEPKTDTKGDGKTESKPETKTESKPESKPETKTETKTEKKE
jgi:putative FmdB family regulatory protein